MERTPVVVGNWKMELSHKGELELARALKRIFKGAIGVQVVVCPSYPSLMAVHELVGKTEMGVGAQNVHSLERGALTGAVAVDQVAPFVDWCIVGHSEVRELMGVTDDEVERQVNMLLSRGIAPIVCVGETWEEREADQTVAIVSRQIQVLLKKMTRSMLTKIVVAYEPIWAISSQAPESLPDPGEAAGIMLLIRKLAAERFDGEAAERLRILYGGSVDQETVSQYVREPGVDGVLVGHASLTPRNFAAIVKAVIDVG